MTSVVTVPPIYYDIRKYQAHVDGTTDDSSIINSTIALAGAAGGGFVYIPGVAAVASPINLNIANVVLIGNGEGSGLRPLAGFSGAQIVNITADFCGIRDMSISYTNTTYSSNPAANGIQLTGARSVTLRDVHLSYINGWALQSSATSSIANYWTQAFNIHSYRCGQGTHVLGVSGSAYSASFFGTNLIMDQVQNGDAYLIEDAHDVTIHGANGNVTAGSGYSMRIKGASAAVYITDIDLGPYPGPATSASLEFETGTGSTPQQVTINGGIIEGGNTGATIVAGSQIRLVGIDFYNNGTHGLNISGGDNIIVDDCSFYLNGATAGASHYDYNCSTSGDVLLRNCTFKTPQGTGAQQVANVINDTNGVTGVQGCHFNGTSFTSANIFNNLPKVIRSCRGYNPVGSVTAPTIGASPYTSPTKSTDMTIYFGATGTISDISIGGVSTGRTTGTFRLPAGQAITVTYSVLPTWTWFSD